MKKKLLLLTLLVMLFVCLLAVSVSAQTIISENNLDENGDIVADVLTDLGNDHHLLSVDISYKDINGQDKTGKFYYETSYWSQRNMRQAKIIYVPADFDLSQMIYFFDKADYDGNENYAANELTKLHEGGGGFKMYSYTSYENGTFTDTANIVTSIQRISYSKYFVKLPDSGFGSKAPKLTTITYNGREPIEGALIVSPLIDEIFGGSFGGDGSSETVNTVVTPFTKLIFEDRETSVSFGTYCFTRCMIEEIYFGKGTYGLGSREKIALLFEKNYANGEGATLKTIILHKEAKISSGEISWNVGNYDVVVLGTESESKEFYEANNQSRLPCAKSVTYNPCYYGHTSESDNNCSTALICSVCNQTLEEAREHTLDKAWEYKKGFLNVGTYTEKCTNADCLHCAEVQMPPLFVSLGYSAPEYSGSTGIAVGFAANEAAISEYTEVTGKSVGYGLFAVLKDRIGDKDIFASDGTAADGVVSTNISRFGYEIFEIKIVGFGEEHKDMKIAMGAYVEVTDGEATEYIYLQSGTPEENERYCFVSYNDVVAPANNEE